jgi:patatin-like phospholipase/acyl hydrolase
MRDGSSLDQTPQGIPASGRFQILSLDGGGIRGVFSAAILAAIEEDLELRLVDHFDLIAGTSTGGIIALGLGLGLRPADILAFYTEHGPRIFRNPWRLRSALWWFWRKYRPAALGTALRTTFGDRPFGESSKRLVIPSYNVGDDDVYIFRTAHAERLRRDYRVPAWKVALATSAAPTYFPACREVDGLRLIDGGVWANNPRARAGCQHRWRVRPQRADRARAPLQPARHAGRPCALHGPHRP